MGTTLLLTDQHEWSTAEILLAYRGQAQIEDAFKIMKDPEGVCVWPFFHWTDQKMQVHLFCCVLALTLTSLLYRQVRQQGLTLSFEEMLTQLRGIHQVVVVSAPQTPGRHRLPTLDVVLSEMNPTQQRVYDDVHVADNFPP